MAVDNDSTPYSFNNFEISDNSGDDELEVGSVGERSQMDVGDRKRGHEGETSSASVGFVASEAVYSSGEMSASPDVHSDGVPSIKLSSCARVVDCEEDQYNAKKKFMNLRRKVAAIRQQADALEKQRHAEELRVGQQEQRDKASWHLRIHRGLTEVEWHEKIATKTARSIVDAALHRDAWIKGMTRARAREDKMEAEFSAAIGSICSLEEVRKEANSSAERQRGLDRAKAYSTVWDAARCGVPVQRLRELMEEKFEATRRTSHVTNPSRSFKHLCRRARGVIVESRHPYPKGILYHTEAWVPGAECFFIAFDAASNATAGAGKVTLQHPNAGEPCVFSVRGPYCSDSPGETRLPGVDGEPPMRVDGSSILVTFSASYWRGVATAGEDYGWRLICFTVDSGKVEDAQALIAEAGRAADREEAVEAVNVLGETCLHVACFGGNIDAARYLLSLDANPNAAHTAGGCNTPLHEASRIGSLPTVQLLLKSSASVYATNSHGDLPLHVACRLGRVDIARCLLAHDSGLSTVGARNDAGHRPIDIVQKCTHLVSLLSRAEAHAANGLSSRGDRSPKKHPHHRRRKSRVGRGGTTQNRS